MQSTPRCAPKRRHRTTLYPEVRPIADVNPLHELDRKALREHARVVQALRDLADRMETLPDFKVREVLPIVAWDLEQLLRRLGPWLR